MNREIEGWLPGVGDWEINGEMVIRLKFAIAVLLHSEGLVCGKLTAVRTPIHFLFAEEVHTHNDSVM